MTENMLRETIEEIIESQYFAFAVPMIPTVDVMLLRRISGVDDDDIALYSVNVYVR